MYMRDPVGDDNWARVPLPSRLALAFSVLVVLGLGVYPGPVLSFARLAAQAFR
jgi:NADH:ubiquinone oxidoreductase subunit 2 (subunit N)